MPYVFFFSYYNNNTYNTSGLFAWVWAHMPRMCLWHAWSDVCWLFHCFFDCLKELNINSTYDRHIPLQINHMSGIIRYNNFSTITSERIIFLLCNFQYSNAHDLCNMDRSQFGKTTASVSSYWALLHHYRGLGRAVGRSQIQGDSIHWIAKNTT